MSEINTDFSPLGAVSYSYGTAILVGRYYL